MPATNVRGAHINYEIFGASGPWVAFSPGSRRAYKELVPLSREVAASGYRVLLHDRRNCGQSDVIIEGDDPEFVIWADDLYELLKQVASVPAFLGGSSSGCRLSLLFAKRHPEAVRGLMLWRISGGPKAVMQLQKGYYGKYIEIAREGGMKAICESEFFKARIEARPENGARLMKMDPAHFIAVMERWRQDMLQSMDYPVIGASEAELRAMAAPACLIPGNDVVHNPQTTRRVASLLPHAEIRSFVPERPESDLLKEWSRADWFGREAEQAAIFVDFMRRVEEREGRGVAC